MAFKPAEDNPQEFILRCYESQGEAAELSLHSDLGMFVKGTVDLLERSPHNTESSVTQQPMTIQPWKITTAKVTPAPHPHQE